MITTENKKVIADTIAHIYTDNFYTPIYELGIVWNKWINTLDEYQFKALNNIHKGNKYANCDMLYTKKDNISYFHSGETIEFEMMYSGLGVSSFFSFERNKIIIPSWSKFIYSLTSHNDGFNGSLDEYVDLVVNGDYKCDLITLKKFFESDWTDLFTKIAEIMMEVITKTNESAEIIREQNKKNEDHLLTEFGIISPIEKHYKTISISISFLGK